MDIIETGKNGKYLIALEKYHVYRTSENNLHMNDTYINTYNPIFKTLYELYIKYQHTQPQSCYKSRISDTEHS
jgi:hypothetical protein